ncbi:hypothetical protein [Spiroplasma endosymbiont of Labia minor]|uniref:hypothetical protein n=1 Tax=Spiroplasma endosymbiont of Labia minor TaxID=3066305 RepID=UPI0030D19CD3
MKKLLGLTTSLLFSINLASSVVSCGKPENFRDLPSEVTVHSIQGSWDMAFIDYIKDKFDIFISGDCVSTSINQIGSWCFENEKPFYIYSNWEDKENVRKTDITEYRYLKDINSNFKVNADDYGIMATVNFTIYYNENA